MQASGDYAQTRFYLDCSSGHWSTVQPSNPCHCFVSLGGYGVPDSFVGTGDSPGGPFGAEPPTAEECCYGLSPGEDVGCDLICMGQTREYTVNVDYNDVNCVSCWTHVWPLGPCAASQCYSCAQKASQFEQNALNGILKLTCKLALCANVCE